MANVSGNKPKKPGSSGYNVFWDAIINIRKDFQSMLVHKHGKKIWYLGKKNPNFMFNYSDLALRMGMGVIPSVLSDGQRCFRCVFSWSWKYTP